MKMNYAPTLKNGILGVIEAPEKCKMCYGTGKYEINYKTFIDCDYCKEALVKAMDTFVPFKKQESIKTILFNQWLDKASLGSTLNDWQPEEGKLYELPKGYKLKFRWQVFDSGKWFTLSKEGEIKLKYFPDVPRRKVAILTPIKEEGKNTNFYCQRDIEGQSICLSQCLHCKEYYKPLEYKPLNVEQETQEETVNDCFAKLKDALILTFERYGDKKFFYKIGKSSTGFEMAEEVRSESKEGLTRLMAIIKLSVNLLMRDKIHLTK